MAKKVTIRGRKFVVTPPIKKPKNVPKGTRLLIPVKGNPHKKRRKKRR